MNNDTVRSVCDEIRNSDPKDDYDIPWTKPELLAFLERIENAHDRECLEHYRQGIADTKNPPIQFFSPD